MSDLSRNDGDGKTARSAACLLGLLPLVGMLAACGGGGGGGGPNDPDQSLIVLASTPTNGQETLTDMSDPGLDGKLTVRFTTTPRVNSMIDGTNAFNGVTPNVQILDQTFARVPGQPTLDSSNASFTFTPEGGVLSPNQYTLTISKFISTSAGRQLNSGVDDYSTSWCVGPDVYPPVVRNVSPAPLQNDTPLYAPIIVTFNESLDPVSVVYGQTVFVEDGGTNPPTLLTGTIALKRDGFDLVFTPDPCSGMPPSTTVVVRLLGTGNVSALRDKVGNIMVGNTNLGGGVTEYQFQFNTKGTKPLPNPKVVPYAGSPFVFGGPPVQAVYASTATRTVAFDTIRVSLDFAQNFTYRPELTQQVLAANVGLANHPPPSLGLLPYGGDWEAKVGKPGEGVVDYRFDTATGYTYLYQIDEANERVAIINASTGKVEGHFNGVGTPKGIGISGPGGTGNSPTLFISNFGQGTVTALPLNSIVPGKPICTAVQELQDDISRRLFMISGRNPIGVALQPQGVSIGAVVNQGDSDVQFFDPRTLKPVESLGLGTLSQKYPVGEGPIDVAFAQILNIGQFALIVSQGGESNPTGSVAMWWNNTGGPFSTNSGAIQGTEEDGLNIPGRPIYDWLNGLAWLVPNTAGDDMAKVDLVVQGGGLFSTFQPQVNINRTIGNNPTKICYTGATIAFASLAGQGQVAVWELNGLNTAPALFNLPGVRNLFCAYDQ